MGKAPARDYVLATTRPRRASAASIGSYADKPTCGFPDCQKSFRRRGDLKRHELLHLGIKDHKCYVCKKQFSQNSGLKTHMNTHTGDKPYRCTYEGCDAEFGDPSSHARHRKETHQVNYHYKCPTEGCISAIKRRSAFAAHLKAKHDIVVTSKELDIMKKVSKSAPSQRRRASKACHTHALALAMPEIIDSVDLNRSVTPLHLFTIPKLEQISPPRDILYRQRSVETQFYDFHANQSHQSDVLSPFSTPMLSSSTLSTFSSQSSTDTLVEDFIEDYTRTKNLYADVAGHAQNDNPIIDFTPPSSPAPVTPMASPLEKDAYRPSPSLMNAQDYLRMNAQIAYDHHQYVPTTGGNPILYSFGYTPFTSQAQEKDFGYFHPQQNPLHYWQPHQPHGWPGFS